MEQRSIPVIKASDLHTCSTCGVMQKDIYGWSGFWVGEGKGWWLECEHCSNKPGGLRKRDCRCCKE